MEKLLNVLSWLAVALLTLQALWTMTHSNFSFGLLLVVGLALVAWVVKLFWLPLKGFFLGSLGGKICLGLLGCGFVFLAGMLAFVALSGYSCQPQGDEKVMIVLGAGLRKDKPSLLLQYRLNKAYQYWQEHPDVLVVTTGGQGRDETCPEGYAMKKYLIEKGIPEEQIISEEKSTSTEENFLFAKELLAQRGISAQDPMVLVTNAFHCYRGRQYAKFAGFTQAYSLPAGIPVSTILPCYLREVFAILYYWVFKTSRTGLMHPFVGLMSLNKRYFYPHR